MRTNEFLREIGMEIRIARIRKRLTIEQVGKICGLHPKTIMEIENGKGDSHILTYKRITDALGVQLRDIL